MKSLLLFFLLLSPFMATAEDAEIAALFEKQGVEGTLVLASLATGAWFSAAPLTVMVAASSRLLKSATGVTVKVVVVVPSAIVAVAATEAAVTAFDERLSVRSPAAGWLR